MAINNIYSYKSTLRIGGLATGIDTDMTIQSLMRIERLPLDKLYQKKQLAEWKRDNYRDITSLLKSFQDEFFDVLKPASNMRSQSLYQKYTATSSDTSVVTATGGAGVTSLAHTITVEQIATAAKAEGTGMVSKPMVGRNIQNIELNAYNNSFKLTYNGVTKTITLPTGTYANAADIVGNGSDGKLKQLVKQAFSDVDVSVDASGGLKFTSTNASDVIKIASNPVSDNLLSALKLNGKGEGEAISFPLDIEKGRKFTLSIVDGGVTTTKEIEWSESKTYATSDDLAADIQMMADAAFGSGKVVVNGADGRLSITKGDDVTSLTVSNSTNNNKVVGWLGFDSGDSNKLSLSDTMEKVASKLQLTGSTTEGITFNGDKLKVTINGVDVEVSKSDTLSTFINKVNDSTAGVTMSYSTFTDTFTMISKTTGEGTITLNDNGSNFFANAKLTTVESGKNAQFTLDGISATRTSNTFLVDGVTYTLLAAKPGVEQKVTLTQDTDAVFNAIKNFVDKYNELISKINGELTEKYDRNYLPLTSEQKESMKEDDIKKWEEKAKTGLLKNDSVLTQMLSNFRKALYDGIKDVSGGLYSIGITTGTYEQKGKLTINESKLREAIQSNPDKVASIFARESEISYSPDADNTSRTKRYNESGIIHRLYDILQDNIRTTRDNNGKKGLLIEKAGILGDASELSNIIYEEIEEYNKKINSLEYLLIDKENRYYEKFAAMEKAIAQMNSQSSWLASQLGGR